MSTESYFQPISFSEPLARPSGFIVLPALSLIVFLRRNVGWRLIRPWWIFALTLFLVFFPIFPDWGGALFRVAGMEFTATGLFGLTMASLAAWHFNAHFGRRKRGESFAHGFHSGDPLLAFLPLPRFVLVILIEPLLAFYAGWSLNHYRPVFYGGLGLWLMVSAVALALFGLQEGRYNFRRGADMDDMDIEAGIAAKRQNRPSSKPERDDDVLNANPGSGQTHQRRSR
jgi:hypothetical protein